jgi:solute carrier family 35 protein E1
VVVILASVAFFRNPVSPLNWVGSGMAIAGTYWYTQAKEAEKQAAIKK